MKIQRNMIISISKLAVAFLFGVTSAQDSFQPITTSDLGTISSIDLGPSCGNEGLQKAPNTMFTILPGDSGSDAVISSSPANLVSASAINGMLSFQWNDAVASNAFEGGVRITVPADTLTSVTVLNASNVQVLDGFTSVTSMTVSGSSIVKAKFSTSSPGRSQSLTVSGASTVNVDSNVSVSGSVSGASTVNIGTTLYNNFVVDGASKVGVAGDLGSGPVSGASTLTATGETLGLIDASGASTVNAATCSGVSTSGASSCNQGQMSVSVNTDKEPDTIAGNYECYGYNAWSAASTLSSLHSVIAASATVVLVSQLLA